VSAKFRGCTIWQVARATSAATTFFKPATVGRESVEFVDAAFGYNNPCEILIGEARRQYPDHEKIRVLSIGTGLGDVVAIKNNRRSIINALKRMATSSKMVATRLDSEYRDGDEYHRFNVDQGLQDITLSDWEESRPSRHIRTTIYKRIKGRSKDLYAVWWMSPGRRSCMVVNLRWIQVSSLPRSRLHIIKPC
jgi:hypothetical protein